MRDSLRDWDAPLTERSACWLRLAGDDRLEGRAAVISRAQPDYEQIDADVRLMLAVREGSATAFQELVRKYKSQVLGFLELRSGDRHQAEDLLQEVFLRVFRSRHSYEPRARFSTWLTVIARNVAANAARDQARRLETYLPSDEHTYLKQRLAHRVSGESPTARLERDEMRTVVRSAINQLCQRQRQAVELQCYHYMRHDQIAEILDSTPKAVKSLLARARGRLRDELEPYVLHHDS